MDHDEAVRLRAVVKYVLGELPETERDSFEEHYFDCGECALDECKTFANLAKSIAGDKKSGKIVGLDEDNKVALCSLVEKIETKLGGVDSKQHLIEVKNFGKIFLAELFAAPGTRTLTMLRLELGSPHVADLTVAETTTNGQPPPPTH